MWPTSNKSYRPLTILALRVQFSVGNRILRGVSHAQNNCSYVAGESWLPYAALVKLHDAASSLG